MRETMQFDIFKKPDRESEFMISLITHKTVCPWKGNEKQEGEIVIPN